MSRLASSCLVAALVLALSVTAAAGCGTSQQEREKQRRQAAEQKRLKEKAATLAVEIRQLREQQAQLTGAPQPGEVATTTTPATTTTTTPATPAGPSTACGGGIAAGPRTTCSFALNTAKEWVDTSAGNIIQAYSSEAKKSYTMNCVNGATATTCRGGRGFVVYIR